MISVSSTISLLGVLSGLSPILFFSLNALFDFHHFYVVIGVTVLHIAASYCYVTLKYHHDRLFNNQNFLIAFSLGLVSTMAIFAMLHWPTHWIFFVYIVQLCFFHWSEFFITSVSNPPGAKVDLYMLNHSTEYKIALCLSVIEYSVEKFWFPMAFAELRWLALSGLAMSAAGEALRKVALWTAGRNFNHYVQVERRADHVLVRHGVYAWCRHPSYVGWFFFSVGTQVALLNPVCVIGYSLASWKFFSERIYDEERSLVRFFGDDYLRYQREVGTGLPFIRGFVKRSS